jgi:hypothetical protein
MARLRSHIGEAVNYKNPTTGGYDTGKVIDEAWPIEPDQFPARAPKNKGWPETAVVAQLIERSKDYTSVRVTYWVRPEDGDADSWRFGGQYSADQSLEDFRVLLQKLNAKNW